MSTIQEIIQQASRFEEETTKQLIGKAIEILNELAIRAYLDNDSCINVDTSDNDLPAAQKSRREFNTRNGIRPEKHRQRWTDDEVAVVQGLRQAGWSDVKIANHLRRAPRAVKSKLSDDKQKRGVR